MTIYKTVPSDQKQDKKLVQVEVASEPLTGDKEDAVATAKIVRVTYNPLQRKTCCNLSLIVIGILILGAGVIGAVFLYRHLATRVYQIHYRQYYDKPTESMQKSADLDYFDEDVEVSAVDEYERLDVPKFDECEHSVVWHDFKYNFTAIVDHHMEICYIMDLNYTLIAPPKDTIDLLTKIQNRYYLPRASVIRKKYRVAQPALSDLTVLGPFIMRACYWFETYKLEKIVEGVYRRSVDAEPHVLETNYGFSTFKDSVFKLIIYKPLPAQTNKDAPAQ